MDLQLVIFNKANLNEELTSILSLVSLKLDHLSVFWMFNNSTIASKFLLKGFYKFLLVVVIRYSLDSGQSFPAVSLLDPYMNGIFCARWEPVITLTCISKGVEGMEVLDSGHTIR